jgi:hypothetical protein
MLDMLVVNSRERKPCVQIREKLKRLQAACRLETYAIKPSPWLNGEHLTPKILLRASEIRLSEDAERQTVRNRTVKKTVHAV